MGDYAWLWMCVLVCVGGYVCWCVCVCVCACVRACLRACVRVCCMGEVGVGVGVWTIIANKWHWFDVFSVKFTSHLWSVHGALPERRTQISGSRQLRRLDAASDGRPGALPQCQVRAERTTPHCYY